MKNPVDPKMAAGVVAALVLIIAAGVFLINKGGGSAPVDVSHFTKDQLGDPAPLHPNQPGYRAYTTDPVPASPAPAKKVDRDELGK